MSVVTVKVTKEKAHYRKGRANHRCGICSMYRGSRNPDEYGACTAVKGLIHTQMTCDYFEKKLRACE